LIECNNQQPTTNIAEGTETYDTAKGPGHGLEKMLSKKRISLKNRKNKTSFERGYTQQNIGNTSKRGLMKSNRIAVQKKGPSVWKAPVEYV